MKIRYLLMTVAFGLICVFVVMVTLSSLISTTYAFPSIHSSLSSSTVFTVCPNGPPACDHNAIQAAVNAASAGDTVLVMPGTYHERISLGLGRNDIWLKSQAGPEVTIIDGANVSAPPNQAVEIRNNSGNRLEGFTIRGTNNFGTGLGGGLWLLNVSSTKVSANIIEDNLAAYGGGIYIGNSQGVSLERNVIQNNSSDHGSAVCLNGAIVTATQNLIQGNVTNGGAGIIHLIDSSLDLENNFMVSNTIPAYYSDSGAVIWSTIPYDPGEAFLRIVNNTIAGNIAYIGIDTSYYGANARIINNILSDAPLGIKCSSAGVYFSHNDLWNNRYQSYSGCADPTGTEGNISGNPLLSSTDYHLWTCSRTLIDAGLNEAAPLIDFDGDPRPVAGSVDIGADEYTGTGVCYAAHLPCITKNYCPDFFDNFNNSASGWDVGEDDYVRREYFNGEYRVLTKQSGYFYFFGAPTCNRENYIVEADARWAGIPGSAYGLIFGMTGNFDGYYLFDVNTDYQQYRLLRRDLDGFVTIAAPTFSAAIRGGTTVNHLRVTRSSQQISVIVNGTVLGTWNDTSYLGMTGTGIVVQPYSNQPSADARFDNYSVSALPSTSAGMNAKLSDIQIAPNPTEWYHRYDSVEYR
jgi:hypothetical protein